MIHRIWTRRPGAPPASAEEARRYREEFRAQIDRANVPFGIWVAESESAVVGWAGLSRMRSNPALRGIMAECSMYVARSHWGATASDALWAALTAHATATSLEWIVSLAASTNAPAVSFCKRHRMQRMGRVPRTAKAPERPPVEVWLWEVGRRTA